jgi:hypothetical protein
MIDIPLAKDIDPKTPIEIQTETGIFRLFPLKVARGLGEQKWSLSIRGVCHSEAETMKPCHVLFKGRKIEGAFSKVGAVDYVWHVTYNMIIAIPEFWSEA